MFGKKPPQTGGGFGKASSQPHQSPTPPHPPADEGQESHHEEAPHRQLVPTQKSNQVAASGGFSSLMPFMATKVSVAASPKEAMVIYTDSKLETPEYIKAKEVLMEKLFEIIDFQAAERLSKEAKKTKFTETIENILRDFSIPLTSAQQAHIKRQALDEILGFGPLEPLLLDAEVSDIMINTHRQVYIEKHGKILLSDVTFLSEKHLMNVVQKIVTQVGRRVDETSPMVDARMPDGSRFNAIIPPLALDGALVSIRKFKKNKMPLSQYIDYNSMSADMCRFLEICGNIRLNILISGGTGSGKTTLLNALSGHIDVGERVITIEDAAELQLHQPHVLRLETRPSNLEGKGEISQRQLVKNALRMRPDRIILGEIRGDEVIDVLAAMNTGHEGSMATIHANTPRDCLSRIENLVGLAGISMPLSALRQQVASALHVIVQIARMRDGRRRITHIEEVVGMEGDVITTQTLFGYMPGPPGDDGVLTGKFFCAGIRPRFLSQATYYGREKDMLESLHIRAG